MVESVALAVGFLLVLAGLYGVLTRRNIIRMIIGFSVFDTGLHVVMVTMGSMRGRTAPILDESVSAVDAVQRVADPIPQALVLTAIVIGLGITALMLAFALRMARRRRSLDIRHFEDLKW